MTQGDALRPLKKYPYQTAIEYFLNRSVGLIKNLRFNNHEKIVFKPCKADTSLAIRFKFTARTVSLACMRMLRRP